LIIHDPRPDLVVSDRQFSDDHGYSDEVTGAICYAIRPPGPGDRNVEETAVSDKNAHFGFSHSLASGGVNLSRLRIVAPRAVRQTSGALRERRIEGAKRAS